MPTPQQLLLDAAAAIVAVTGATRLGSDYRDDLERIPLGGLRYALRGGPRAVDVRNANLRYVVEQIELDLEHQLADPANERAYTEGAMQTHVAALVDPTFWRDLASAHSVIELPTYKVDRSGSLIVVTIQVAVSIKP